MNSSSPSDRPEPAGVVDRRLRPCFLALCVYWFRTTEQQKIDLLHGYVRLQRKQFDHPAANRRFERLAAEEAQRLGEPHLCAMKDLTG